MQRQLLALGRLLPPEPLERRVAAFAQVTALAVKAADVALGDRKDFPRTPRGWGHAEVQQNHAVLSLRMPEAILAFRQAVTAAVPDIPPQFLGRLVASILMGAGIGARIVARGGDPEELML